MGAAASCMALGALAMACTTYQDDLARGERAFSQNEYERTLAIFRELEPDTTQLSISDQARYAYLRGMTDYRIGYRADARHWLSIAKSIDKENPTALQLDWKKRLADALADMNEAVFTTGYSSLTNTESGEKSPTSKADDSSGGATWEANPDASTAGAADAGAPSATPATRVGDAGSVDKI